MRRLTAPWVIPSEIAAPENVTVSAACRTASNATATHLALPILAAADPGSGCQGRHENMMWGGGFGMIGGLTVMFLFWGIVITLIYFIL